MLPITGPRVHCPPRKGSAYCWNHDPARAEERSRNASRAASAKHSSIAQELRDIREVVWKVVCLRLEGRLKPAARRELTNIIQLLQIYLRSAEVELAAGEKPERGSVAPLPADLLEKVQQFITDPEAQRAED